jgi:hypothetical protein
MLRTNVTGTTAPSGSGAQRCAEAGERKHRTDSTARPASTTATGATTLPTRICSHCGERFALGPRRGRNSDKRQAMHGARVYHLGARYCTPTCRKAASKGRRRSSTVARKAQKALLPSTLLSSVTSAENSIDLSVPYDGEKTGRGSSKTPNSPSRGCLIGPHDYPINVLGGYRFPQAKPVPKGVP